MKYCVCGLTSTTGMNIPAVQTVKVKCIYFPACIQGCLSIFYITLMVPLLHPKLTRNCAVFCLPATCSCVKLELSGRMWTLRVDNILAILLLVYKFVSITDKWNPCRCFLCCLLEKIQVLFTIMHYYLSRVNKMVYKQTIERPKTFHFSLQ